MDCSSRQAIEPLFGQLGSEPAEIIVGVMFLRNVCAQTLLLSSELCQVALPNATGFGANWFGLVSGLRKCVMIWKGTPNRVVNSVASGRAPLTVQDAPVAVGR